MRILILLVLTGCGNRVDGRKAAIVIAPEMATTIQDIQEEGAERGVVLDLSLISVRLVETLANPSWAGTCGIGQEGPAIEISRPYWTKATEAQKYNLLIHEIGHCYFGLEHESGDLAFMNAVLLHAYEVTANWDELNDKFFDKIDHIY